MYIDDINKLGEDLYFQQDELSLPQNWEKIDHINCNFPKKFDFWHDKFTDLSPIEELGTIFEKKQNKDKISFFQELYIKLVYLRKRLPKTLLKK